MCACRIFAAIHTSTFIMAHIWCLPVATVLLLGCTAELTQEDKDFLGRQFTQLKDEIKELEQKFEDEMQHERKFGALQAAKLDRCTIPVYKDHLLGVLTLVESEGSLAVVSAMHNLEPILYKDCALHNVSGLKTNATMLAHWELHFGGRDICASVDKNLIDELFVAKPDLEPCELTQEDFRLGERAVIFARNQPVKVSVGEIVGTAECDDSPVRTGDLLVSGRIRPGFSGTASVANHRFMGIAVAEIKECKARCTQDACNSTDPGAHALLGVVSPAAAVRDVVRSAMAHKIAKEEL